MNKPGLLIENFKDMFGEIEMKEDMWENMRKIGDSLQLMKKLHEDVCKLTNQISSNSTLVPSSYYLDPNDIKR
jgi:hypothetical protein